MTTLPRRIGRALEQFHATRPWDHNAHYHRWLLRQLPRRFTTALDIGSGSGDLARLLAARAGAVRGIDVDPAIVDRARELTDPAAPVPANVAMAWIRNRGRKAPRPSSMTASTRPATTTFDDIVRDARQALPGARLRRRLFWRYTLVWHRQEDVGPTTRPGAQQ
ncbi:Methyltransferase domain-containing protein [Streptomyces sp. DvalAA-14]|uniref:methyltransferase domain-containing protein n=1 Tax=unclassified Streptomyces TaxID=2593676 RepID=UPI00081BBECC|nr:MULTISPECIES: methyltransferase domain-containing protein [unclassified Streptomyces]MYS21825.1 methyltransferase domain-containing protein [Streptomyces sp. SID4948]SCE01888.1 Methyltransferase domain-containing protein [Streptomyces sp. DvalAA-14]